jgi:hypothetical protein
MPFAAAAELLNYFMGVNVDSETARRQTLAAGVALVAAETEAVNWLFEDAPEPRAPPATHQLISVDGAMVPLIGEWAEVRTLAIGAVERGKDGEPKATNLSYFSRLCDAATFSRLATVETQRRATDRAGRVTAVVDGADWIQEFLSVQCPSATRIIDWGHSSGYVAAAARALFGNDEERQRWQQAQLRELWEGSVDAVLAELGRQLAALPVDAEAAQVVSQSLVYLAKRVDHLHYAAFRAAGLPIGSGCVESANKLVVEARLKGAGMRWQRGNVDPMLALRNATCSDRWPATWPTLQRYRCARARERSRSHRRLHTLPAPPPPPPKHRGRPWRDFRLPGSPPPLPAKR